MLSRRSALPLLLVPALAAFLIDQLSKLYILFSLGLGPGAVVDVLPPLLRFKFAWNYGINFGLFSRPGAPSQWPLILLGLAIMAFVLIWVWRSHRTTLPLLCTGLLIGGAFGNILDRMWHGAVVDFLNMSCCGVVNPFAFNLADVFIFAGAIGLVVFAREQPSDTGV